MRVLVTGATGTLGLSVVRALSADPDVAEVQALARRPATLALPRVVWRTGDVEHDDLARHLDGVDAVVHLAGALQPSHDRDRLHNVNVKATDRLLAAVEQSHAHSLVYPSSVAVYAPRTTLAPVDERWPLGGIRSWFAEQKRDAEELLTEFAARGPQRRIVILRLGMLVGREAATRWRRRFAGPLMPHPCADPRWVLIAPRVEDAVVPVIHTDDAADAVHRALKRPVEGAFNVVAEPALTMDRILAAVGARGVPVPRRLLLAAADATWRLRLQPADPGWYQLALELPVADCTRAHQELDWRASHSATDAWLELLHGVADKAGGPSPPLDPDAGGPLRLGEVLSESSM